MLNWERDESVSVLLSQNHILSRVHRQSGRVTSWFSPFQSPSHSLSSLYRSLSDQSVDGKAPLAFLTPNRDHQQKQRSVARGYEHLFPIRLDKKKDKQKTEAHQNKTKTAEQENISIIASWMAWWSVFDRRRIMPNQPELFFQHTYAIEQAHDVMDFSAQIKLMHTAFFGLARTPIAWLVFQVYVCVFLAGHLLSFSDWTNLRQMTESRMNRKIGVCNTERQGPKLSCQMWVKTGFGE